MEADILNLYHFGWYEWVYFCDVKTAFPYQKECLGRCLGPAKNEGNVMAQWILKQNGKVAPCPTLRCLSSAELSLTNKVEYEKRVQFDTAIQGRLRDSYKIPKDVPLDNDATVAFNVHWNLDPYEDDSSPKLYMPDADLKDAAGKLFVHQLLADTLINAEALLPNEDSQAITVVVR